jgi:hypothetical protein
LPAAGRAAAHDASANPQTVAKVVRHGSAPTPAATITHPAKKPQPVSLCVSILRSQPSRDRGKPAQWTISAWTRGGTVQDAIIRLQVEPASVSPKFSFGCGSHNGTAACDLGTVDSNSAVRELKAQVTVPVSAAGIRSVRLIVVGSAAHLSKDPTAAAAIAITTPAPVTTPGTPTPQVTPVTFSPLPVGTLPGVQPAAASPTLSPGGNAGNLFPTLSLANGKSGKGKKATTRVVANVSALPGGASVIGAQLLGLAALALAFVLAVTRLTVRRRPVPQPSAPTDTEAGAPEAKAPEAEAPKAIAPEANRTHGDEDIIEG